MSYIQRMLIANRGEIAVRIARSAADMGIQTVGVVARGDEGSSHALYVDEVVELGGVGVEAYLAVDDLISVAVSTGCDTVHPGYGFLSESPAFAERCETAGLTFVGPDIDSLRTFGDKAEARRLADECGVPVLPGTEAGVDVASTLHFWDSLPDGYSIMLKAVAGGGGRGTRAVHDRAQLVESFARCQSEAASAFGDGTIYAEALMSPARHVEVQVVGDGTGAAVTIGDRDCSVQRRHQKLLEMAPAPHLEPAVRARLHEHAVAMASRVRYRGVGTWEFLIDPRAVDETGVRFLEVNPRIQVEHTVTEEVWEVDLVGIQLAVASGEVLDGLNLPVAGQEPQGWAVQARVLAEAMDDDGVSRPAMGRVDAIQLPGGRGVRVDHALHEGLKPDPRFDPLLAKVIVHHREGAMADVLRALGRELDRADLGSVETNLGLLSSIATDEVVLAGQVTTTFVDENRSRLLQSAADKDASRAGRRRSTDGVVVAEIGPVLQGAVTASMPAVVIDVAVAVGDEVSTGQKVVVLEAMKMEHVITSDVSGTVGSVLVEPGEVVDLGQPLFLVTPGDVGDLAEESAVVDLDAIRPDLEVVLDRKDRLLDHRRTDVVERRHAAGRRTARENIADLLDGGSFIEYGGLAIAAQRARRDHDELVERTPADGMVGGVGQIAGTDCMTFSYDYTVLAGTQGTQNHRKKDRLIDIAERQGLPVVLFAEGGGGRPGDTDYAIASGLDVTTFTALARLSGSVPLVGVTGGRCFAGNAALLGVCDVIIATEGSNIGMGGPVMVEGGGLGVFTPEEIGSIETQWSNGVVDIRVEDDAAAVAAARTYLSYFTHDVEHWEAPDARALRHVVPENRKQVYDVRQAIDGIADVDSVLELRAGWAEGIITALARIEGRPVGIVANNPKHLGGAIDSPAADKASRFMQLCDAFDIPLLFLCDTPGFMVGPDSEVTATVRHFGRMFANGANVGVPFGTIVLRKAYGLGSQAMAGGGFRAPLFTVVWPTAELGPMGLEGAVRLAHRREMDAISDPVEQQAYFDAAVAEMYRIGSGLHVAEQFEIDDVIDPMESRRWASRLLREPKGKAVRRINVDTW